MRQHRALMVPLLALGCVAATTVPAAAAGVEKETYINAECDGALIAPPTVRVTGGVTHLDLLEVFQEYLLIDGAWVWGGTNTVHVVGIQSEHASAYHGTWDLDLEQIDRATGRFAFGNTDPGRAVGVSVDGTTLHKTDLRVDPAGLDLPPLPSADCTVNEWLLIH
jgi:hypothetical protein